MLGLELGADDYVVKPFSMPELVGRVRANLRRRHLDRGEAGAERRVGELRLDLVKEEKGEVKQVIVTNGLSLDLGVYWFGNKSSLWVSLMSPFGLVRSWKRSL